MKKAAPTWPWWAGWRPTAGCGRGSGRRRHATGLTAHIPSLEFCGDNAAMIAAIGYHLLIEGKSGQMDDDVYSRVAS